MALSLQPSHLKRYKDIIWLFMKYGRSDLVKSAELENNLGDDHKIDPTVIPKADELASDLEKMGPTFIKIGQLLSTRADLLPPAYTEALTRLQDKIKPFPLEQVEQIISSELGVRLSKAFGSLDPVPIAAASLGQVHRATMRDGREVAVKIQRPGIREQMIDDLDSLHEVAQLLEKHTEAGKKYEYVRMIAEFRKALLNELDYRLEAQNLVTLGTNLKEFKHIVVPQPIDDYTTSRVLTMQYIGGHKITTLSPLVRIEVDGVTLAEELFQAYLKQILIDGFFHADPHPGNALLTTDSCIALLDLGMVARVTPRLQDGILQILLAVSEGRGEDTAAALIAISEKKENFDEREFTRQVEDLVARHKQAQLSQIAVGRVVMELCKAAADSGVRSPAEFNTLGKTLMNLDLLGTTLNPDFNPNESIRRNSAAIVQRRLAAVITPGSIMGGLLEAKEFAQRLPARVNKILDIVANNEMKLNVDAIDEDKLMSGFQKVANRITVGLILAALIVGAAILTRVNTPTTIFGYPALATILFLLAAGGGIVLMVQVMFYDEPT